MSEIFIEGETINMEIIVTPFFNLAATMSFIDPFRVANYLEGKSIFKWQLVSEMGGIIKASNGIEVSTKSIEEIKKGVSELVFVSSSWEPERHVSNALESHLRSAARQKTILGGIDTGAFILAQAGLLNGYTATLHYEHIDAFQELFLDTKISESLWVIDRRRVTCCGGAATTDLSLHLIQKTHGSALANAAARYLFSNSVRGPGAPQNPEDVDPFGSAVPKSIRNAIKIMEANLETPLKIADVCQQVGLSHRQLDRIFARFVHKAPALYYRDIRLDRARGLITQTQLTVAEIAFASGFSSQVHFSRAYKDRFGLPPTKDRVQGRVPFEFRAWPMHRASK